MHLKLSFGNWRPFCSQPQCVKCQRSFRIAQSKMIDDIETEISSFWWNFRHWLHWYLSFWQLLVHWYRLMGNWLYPFKTMWWNYSWWRHQMEAFSALLALRAGNSPVPGDFPTQRPVTRTALMFSLICAWINGLVNSREASDFRRHRAHHDVILMCALTSKAVKTWVNNYISQQTMYVIVYPCINLSSSLLVKLSNRLSLGIEIDFIHTWRCRW